jgi:hypothetical protein
MPDGSLGLRGRFFSARRYSTESRLKKKATLPIITKQARGKGKSVKKRQARGAKTVRQLVILGRLKGINRRKLSERGNLDQALLKIRSAKR